MKTLPKLSERIREVLESNTWEDYYDFICVAISPQGKSCTESTKLMRKYWCVFKPEDTSPKSCAFINDSYHDDGTCYTREEVISTRQAFVAWLLTNY